MAMPISFHPYPLYNLPQSPITNPPTKVGTIPILSHVMVGSLLICYPVPYLDLPPSQTIQNFSLNNLNNYNFLFYYPSLNAYSSDRSLYHPRPTERYELWSTKQAYTPGLGSAILCKRNKTGVAPPKDVLLEKQEGVAVKGPVKDKNVAEDRVGPKLHLAFHQWQMQHQKDHLSPPKKVLTDFGANYEGDLLSVLKKEIDLNKRKVKESYQNTVQKYNISSQNFRKFPILTRRPREANISILGPHPSSLSCFSKQNSGHVVPLSKRKLCFHKNSSLHQTEHKMSTLSETDEAFIQKFIELSTEDLVSSEVVVPHKATSSTNWELCLLARIVTDKIVLDGPFAKAMINAWGADPATSLRQVTKNFYLIEFTRLEDLHSALLGGVWRIGDGRSCNAVTHQWFNRVPKNQLLTDKQKRLCVRDLVEEGSGLWNVELLIQLYGHQNCLSILQNVQPPRVESGADKLLFSDSTSGEFSVKLAYKRITHNIQGAPSDKVWKLIWKKGDVLPRVRVFFWKLMHGALPLAKILASRMSRGDPMCVVCKQGEEDVLHMLFTCPFARGCWLLGPLSLRTDSLPQNLSSILELLDQQLTEDVWTNVANQAWAIWRCRNEMVYEGQVPTFERFRLLLNKVSMETRIATAGKKCESRAGVASELTSNPDKVYCCKVDGSWKPPWQGGLGFIVEEGNELKGFRAAPSYACCPLHAEAVALRDAILFVKELGILSCTFYTDNQSLAVICSAAHPPLEADWRAYKEINEIWSLLSDNDYECKHFYRSQNVMADNLAKIGSCLEEGYTGFSYPTFKQ